jgi:hypothetical protein
VDRFRLSHDLHHISMTPDALFVTRALDERLPHVHATGWATTAGSLAFSTTSFPVASRSEQALPFSSSHAAAANGPPNRADRSNGRSQRFSVALKYASRTATT